MQTASSTLTDRVLFGLAFALLLALSLPGVEAHADNEGAAPSARELLSLDPKPVAAPPGLSAQGDSCAASDPALVAKEYGGQREAMQRLAQAMLAGDEGGEFKVLDGRGYGYFPERNAAIDLARLQREAAEQARSQTELAQ
jgi:hypothetical protein